MNKKITKNASFKVDAISNTEHQTDIKSLKEHLPSQFEDQKVGLLQQFTVEENPLDKYQKITTNYIPKANCTECGLALRKNNLKHHFRIYILREQRQNYLFFNCVLRKQKELERREKKGKTENRTKRIRRK